MRQPEDENVMGEMKMLMNIDGEKKPEKEE